MKTKFGVKHYWKPTPRKWREIGDFLLIFSTAFNGAAFIGNYPALGIAIQICGALGKICTNFFGHTYGQD